ncbi:MAG: phenylalanine--tRNA ligase subunit beta [Planctomycetota bacterium]|jgi:phenylalanyl-tRNA synthetase beta chain
MPTVTVQLFDLGRLVGHPIDLDALEKFLPLVKGELKSSDEFSGELRIELADGNRPDLWSSEGIARQIRVMLAGKPQSYPFFSRRKRKNVGKIEVEGALQTVRPYIGGFSVRGLKITEDGLVGMIEAQEKLSEVFGRKRKAIAIGVYNAGKIKWPVHYRAVPPEDRRFIPLGGEEEMNLAEILARHPKGIQYAGLLAGFTRFPFLEDARGRVLSFPPVINSSDAGMVTVGDNHLFVEVTGTDLREVLLAVNIFAVNLADRGGRIIPCEVTYAFDTPLGHSVVTPTDISSELEVPFREFEHVLGVPVDRDAVSEVLGRYDIRVRTRAKSAFVSAPAYRDDYLHPWDAVEDYAVSRGYDAFPPDPLASFTPGGIDPLTGFGDQAREIMVGLGFEEIISNVLTSPKNLRDNMGLSPGGIVEIENVYSETYSVVRDRILPSLLEVEAESVKAMYPHRLFEEGEVASIEGEVVRTERRLAAAVASPTATFSEAHSYLNLLLYYLDVDAILDPADLPGFIEGRAGILTVKGKPIGSIGELHPRVLEAWGIKNPVAAFEINLSALSPTNALS